jgi:hypothetical protein
MSFYYFLGCCASVLVPEVEHTHSMKMFIQPENVSYEKGKRRKIFI